MESNKVTIIGAGLAGCEAAWQLAQRGVPVLLADMKPQKKSPAHKNDNFCELVCSNSLRAADLSCAPGLLKEEMRIFNSLIIQCADNTRVPAGGALAVDRDGFCRLVTEKIRNHPLIELTCAQIDKIPSDGFVIVATGPLTDGALCQDIRNFFGGSEYLHFYDAAAPVVTLDSIDMEHAFFASRYGKKAYPSSSDECTPTPCNTDCHDGDYINCPLTREQYELFVHELSNAEQAEVHGFEDKLVFEGCMPVEVMARRGTDTLRHGPMKPVGLKNPHTGELYHAVLQLRRDNSAGTLFNLVGCQTHLKFGEQKRVFSIIPALKNAEFLRFGVMHRNSYINSPLLLDRYYRARIDSRVMFAGQLNGVEGYIESAASGLYAGINMAKMVKNQPLIDLPGETATGALSLYISNKSISNFQPMNINFGIIAPLGMKIRGKREKNAAISARALDIMRKIAQCEDF